MQSTALSENMKTSFMSRLWFVERDITSQIGSVRPNPVCGRINTDLGVCWYLISTDLLSSMTSTYILIILQGTQLFSWLQAIK